MQRIKFIVAVFAVLITAIAIFFVLSNEKALVAHPKGVIAEGELKLMITHILLMLCVVTPTLVLLFVTAWRYRANNAKAQYDPDHAHGLVGKVILWVIPSVVVVVMAIFTWDATHKLDPYKPLVSEVKPLTIQVVALDWKWLFIYPEQGIASVNLVQFPENTPIHFVLTADGSPMNSFWMPQLSGQIYAMTGMVTSLHLMANAPGEYTGRAAEINGEGFAGMTFVAHAGSQSDFETWVDKVKQLPQQLTHQTYDELTKPSVNHPVALYSHVEEGLFNRIVEKYHDK